MNFEKSLNKNRSAPSNSQKGNIYTVIKLRTTNIFWHPMKIFAIKGVTVYLSAPTFYSITLRILSRLEWERMSQRNQFLCRRYISAILKNFFRELEASKKKMLLLTHHALINIGRIERTEHILIHFKWGSRVNRPPPPEKKRNRPEYRTASLLSKMLFGMITFIFLLNSYFILWKFAWKTASSPKKYEKR